MKNKHLIATGISTILSLLPRLQEVFKKGDTDNDGLINFAEFVEYIIDHEKKLKLAFKTLDSNKDGEK